MDLIFFRIILVSIKLPKLWLGWVQYPLPPANLLFNLKNPNPYRVNWHLVLIGISIFTICWSYIFNFSSKIHLYIFIRVGTDVSSVPCYASVRHHNTIFFDTRRTFYLKEPPAKPLKTYLKDNGTIYFAVT